MGQRLLIVDSDRRFIQDHQAVLESTFDVEILHSTEGALPRLESGQFAAVLLCVEVSENKGYALCSAIRKTAALQGVKIVLISGKATAEEYARHQSLKGRADVYLHKPIASAALVAALTPVVPVKAEDPDNPLGDVGGADLGDEWLDSLKSELDVDPMPRTGFTLAPPAPVPAPAPAFVLPPLPTGLPLLPLSHQATQKLPVVSKDAGRVELLEARVKDLEAKLVAKADEYEKNLHDLTDLKQRHDSVTRNLDDLEQRQAEAQTLHTRLQETQEALKAVEAQAAQSEEGAVALREELKASLAEQQRLLERGEAANALLSEKTQQTMDLMESNQLLQAQLEEARELGPKLREAERALVEAQAAKDDLALRLGTCESTLQSLESALQEAHADLAEKDGLAQELDRVRAEASTVGSLLAEREAALKDLEERYAQQEILAQRLLGETEDCRATRAHLQEAFAELEAQVATMEANHERQQKELMAGIDEREGHLNRLNASIDAQRERIATLETQKTECESLVMIHSERLSSLAGILAELEGKTRQALDLTRNATT